MKDAVKTFNRRVPYAVRLLLVLLGGIFLYGCAESALATVVKFRGAAPDCTWRRTLLFGFDSLQFDLRRFGAGARISLKAQDAKFDIQQFSTGGRDFWIKRTGETKDGKELLGYLLAEHGWMASVNGKDHVKPGDIVLDCGAHVGVFTDMALRRGAGRVVAIEPDPTNLECLRRNFPSEIASGRVIIVPKGVWNQEQIITLYIGAANSGSNSMLLDQNKGKVEVPVTTVDHLVEELHLPRVDFIKMDIEGAEREALRGATRTLSSFLPGLMLDSYHRLDDMQVLPAIIRQANPRYSMICGPCEETFRPHVTYYR